MAKRYILLFIFLMALSAKAKWINADFVTSGKHAGKTVQHRNISETDASVIYRKKDSSGKYTGAGASLPSIAWKNCEQLVLEYDFLMEVAHTHFALLAMTEGKKKIITITIDSSGNVTIFAPSSRINAGKMKFGIWNKIRYVLYPESGKFDFYVNDMEHPVAEKIDFREKSSGQKIRFYTVVDRKNPAGTAFANIRFRRVNHRSFPAADLAGTPFFVTGVVKKSYAPTEKNWRSRTGVVLSGGSNSTGKAIVLKTLRTDEKLFCRIETEKFSEKDKIKLCFQPMPGEYIFQFTGTITGTKECTILHRSKKKTIPAESWKYRVYTDREKAIAEFEIPFDVTGVDPGKVSDTYWQAFFQYSSEEHDYTWGDSGSGSNKEIYGKLIFPENIKNIRQSYNKSAEILYGLSKDISALEKILNSPVEKGNSLPEFSRKILLARLQKIVQNLKNNHYHICFAQHLELQELKKSVTKYQTLLNFVNRTFAPDSPALSQGGAVAILPGARKIVIGEYFGTGSNKISISLAGGETTGFTAVFFPAHDRSGVRGELKWKNLPDNVKAVSYQALPITGTIRNKKPFITFDALLPEKNFVLDKKLPIAVFYFEVTMPRGGKGKDFAAAASISVAGKKTIDIPVKVRYAGFDLPKKTTLDTAFCFRMDWAEKYYGRKLSTAEKENIWRLIDRHRLEPMNLWGNDVDTMVDFCLANTNKKMLFLSIKDQTGVRQMLAKYQQRLNPVFFGFDEVIGSGSTAELSQMLKVCAQAEKEFPQVARLCTVPVDARLFGAIDIWCPHFNTFNADTAAERIKNGETVWWYLTGIPEAPAPNFNLDSPDTASRVIPWLTVKNNISGLLYWSINREFPENAPDKLDKSALHEFRQRQLSWATEKNFAYWQKNQIKWPQRPWISFYSNLNSGKYASQSGSGNLLYPAPDGNLLPSIRLKNLRDGLQDSEYLLLLKKLHNNVSAPELNTQISEMLAMKRIFPGNGYCYTDDMDKILSEKEFLIKLINAAKERK